MALGRLGAAFWGEEPSVLCAFAWASSKTSGAGRRED